MLRRSIGLVAAENIARKRKSCGLTQAQVAERLSVEKESISRMESGRIMLSLERLQQFADVFCCSVSELLWDSLPEVEAQAQSIVELLQGLSPEEREAVVRFVGETVRLLKMRKV